MLFFLSLYQAHNQVLLQIEILPPKNFNHLIYLISQQLAMLVRISFNDEPTDFLLLAKSLVFLGKTSIFSAMAGNMALNCPGNSSLLSVTVFVSGSERCFVSY